MKSRLLIIIGFVFTGMFVAVIPYADASFSDSLLIQVSDKIKKIYYNEKNVTSVLFDSDSASVIFETGSNAELEIKAPRVYKTGPNLFILKNGEEIYPETITDDCFYYTSIETQGPEKIEIIFASWPEYPETIDDCEIIEVSPLLQTKLGVDSKKIQCREELTLLIKHDGSSVCVKYDSVDKLMQRGWANLDNIVTKINIENTKSVISTLYVDSQLVDCVGIISQQCMLVRENQNTEWEFFYDDIIGFDYKTGYEYTLNVSITEIENPPADASSIQYTLIKVEKKLKVEKVTQECMHAYLQDSSYNIYFEYLDCSNSDVFVVYGDHIMAINEQGEFRLANIIKENNIVIDVQFLEFGITGITVFEDSLVLSDISPQN